MMRFDKKKKKNSVKDKDIIQEEKVKFTTKKLVATS